MGVPTTLGIVLYVNIGVAVLIFIGSLIACAVLRFHRDHHQQESVWAELKKDPMKFIRETPGVVLSLEQLEEKRSERRSARGGGGGGGGMGEDVDFNVAERFGIQPEVLIVLLIYFSNYDLDESGLIDSYSELELLATNVAFYAEREFGHQVSVERMEKFMQDWGQRVMEQGIDFSQFLGCFAVPICKLGDPELVSIGMIKENEEKTVCVVDPHILEKLQNYFEIFDLDHSGILDSFKELEMVTTSVSFYAKKEHGIEVHKYDLARYLKENAQLVDEGEGMTFDQFVESFAVKVCQLGTVKVQQTKKTVQALGADGVFNEYGVKTSVMEKLNECFTLYDLDNSGLLDSLNELELLAMNVCFLAKNDYGVEVPPPALESYLKEFGPKAENGEGVSFVEFVQTFAVAICKLGDPRAANTFHAVPEYQINPLHAGDEASLPPVVQDKLHTLFDLYDLDESGILDSYEELELMALNTSYYAKSELGIEVSVAQIEAYMAEAGPKATNGTGVSFNDFVKEFAIQICKMGELELQV